MDTVNFEIDVWVFYKLIFYYIDDIFYVILKNIIVLIRKI